MILNISKSLPRINSGCPAAIPPPPLVAGLLYVVVAMAVSVALITKEDQLISFPVPSCHILFKFLNIVAKQILNLPCRAYFPLVHTEPMLKMFVPACPGCTAIRRVQPI